MTAFKSRFMLVTMIVLALFACSAPSTNGFAPENTIRLAREIIEAYYGHSVGEISKVVWFDFASSGQKNEFFAEISGPDWETEEPFLDVFSRSGPEWRNILHRDGNAVFGTLLTDTVTIEGETYLLSGVCAGSGRFLDLSVYAYNGMEPAREVFAEDDLYQGHFAVKNGRVYVYGDSQKFELRKGPKGFYLSHLKQSYSYDPAKGKHLLRLRDQNDALVVSFDGRVVRFVETRSEKGYVPEFVTVEPIRIGRSHTIIFDNNMYRPRANRVLFEGATWNVRLDGPDVTLAPRKEGKGEILVDFELAKNYAI